VFARYRTWPDRFVKYAERPEHKGLSKLAPSTVQQAAEANRETGFGTRGLDTRSPFALERL
jgi:hypothetical protein